MYRKLIEQLKKWKNKNDRLPLILKGARQVGKTWLLQEFGKECFEDVLYINFENESNVSSLFEGTIEPNRIIEFLGAIHHRKIKPEKIRQKICPKNIIFHRIFYKNAISQNKLCLLPEIWRFRLLLQPD